jgi:HEPN domain-containing protein
VVDGGVVQNTALARDYLKRAAVRVRALDVLYEAGSWADVVREAQEIVELALKGLLRGCGVSPPRVHDVSDVILAEQERLPPSLGARVPRMVAMSRRLRRDRELAFYGAEDLTPSGFYSEEDAEAARADARWLVEVISPFADAWGD